LIAIWIDMPPPTISTAPSGKHDPSSRSHPVPCLSKHCAWYVHATHALVPASQTGVVPVHASALVSVHCTHVPASHTPRSGSTDAQLPSGSAVPEQSTHTIPSQNGVSAPQSSLPSHSAPLVLPSVALTPDVPTVASLALMLDPVPCVTDPLSLAPLVGPVVVPSATPSHSGSSTNRTPPPHGL
jgi:hypothetical protein